MSIPNTVSKHKDSNQWEVEVNKKDIAYIVSIFEGYDHLAVVRTVNPSCGLIELMISPDFLEDTLAEVQKMDLTPVIAHPERMELFQKDPLLLFNLVDRGMLTQITASSVFGKFGGKARRFAEEIIRNNLGHILASDTHMSTGPRCPELLKGFRSVVRVYGADIGNMMVNDTPRAILESRDINIPRGQKLSASGTTWNFLR